MSHRGFSCIPLGSLTDSCHERQALHRWRLGLPSQHVQSKPLQLFVQTAEGMGLIEANQRTSPLARLCVNQMLVKIVHDLLRDIL